MSMQQIVKVVSDETTGDVFGNEWREHYVLYADNDDDGVPCFDLYTDDGQGNGNMICRGYNQGAMRSLTLRLGTWVAWS